ncbi:hypothetical protein Tcan_14924 [Toxocara canis]|uniref:Uncharacterized protein n=1 Tax=Toxocara canis TaxID=6265 RepID=A0A0B2V6N8_TOXCA|nr:hypothetical protein Tcan_14924 [Toxocara canis]
MGEAQNALQQGRSRSLSHPVWQFYEVVQEGCKCPRCGGHELVGLNMTNAMKYLKARHEADYAELVKALNHHKQPVKRNAPLITLEESWRMSSKGAQDSAEKKERCTTVLQKLMALPNVSLSLLLTYEFREYTVVLNPRFVLPTFRGGLCSLLDGPLQVVKKDSAESGRISWSICHC